MSPRLERHAQKMRAEISDPLAEAVMTNEERRYTLNQRNGRRRALQARQRMAGELGQLDTSKAGRRKLGKRLAQGDRIKP